MGRMAVKDMVLSILARLSGNDEPSDGNDSNGLGMPTEFQPAKKSEVIGTSFSAPAGSLLDADVEQLIQQLHVIQIHDSAASSQKSTINVPPGYSMQMQMDSQTYQSVVTSLEKREQRRSQRGFPRLTSRRKKIQHGFDPIQVIRKHAISLPKASSSSSSTLQNEILSLFRIENFHDCAADVYEQLKPALKLASLFITQRATSTFWHTLAFGERCICEETSRKYGRDCSRIIKDVQWNQTKAEEFRVRINTLSNQIHFHFGLLKDPTITPSYTYGICATVNNYQSSFPVENDTQKARICLHTDFYTTAKRLSTLDKRNVDPAMVLRFNFFLAVNLTHEVAHFLELLYKQRGYPGEVFLYEDNWAESGAAFERKVFGGRVDPISARIDCAYGLATYDWPVHSEEDMRENIQWTIPMDYIAWIQQSSTWDNGNTLDATVFHIPRNGARSIGLSALDLTMWEDEEQAEIVDDCLESLNAPLRRLLNGNIVRGSSKGDPLHRTMTGRVVKPSVKKGSVAVGGDEAEKKVRGAKRSSISKGQGRKERRFRVSTRRGELKRPLRSQASTKKKQHKRRTPTKDEIGDITAAASRNRFLVLDSMPIE